MSRRTPTRIGCYEVHELLGRGGMGEVYLAAHADLQRWVVLKTLHRGASEDKNLATRFLREAQAAASLHHQNIVSVYDSFTWRGERYIVHEFVNGEDLADLIKREGALDWRVAALIAVSISRGLEEVHARGILHRDLKPSNVLIARTGDVKIADFGIALDSNGPGLTQTGHALGSPPYMSPEQMMGEVLDPRSDLFAMGVLLYEMLTGSAPFQDSESKPNESLVRRIRHGRYTKLGRAAPKTPRWLRSLTESCLNAKPGRRPNSTTEVRRRLEGKLGRPSPADCRAELAMALWPDSEIGNDEMTVLVEQVEEVESAEREVATDLPETKSYEKVVPLWRWGLDSLALAATLVLGAMLLKPTLAPAWEAVSGQSVPLAPALLEIIAPTGSWVRIDDRPALRSPLSEAIELEPGEYIVVIEDPRRGKAIHRIELRPGERRNVEQRFPQRLRVEPKPIQILPTKDD